MSRGRMNFKRISGPHRFHTFLVLLGVVGCIYTLNSLYVHSQAVSKGEIEQLTLFLRNHGAFIHPFLEPTFVGEAGWALFFNGTEGVDDDGGLEHRRHPQSRKRTFFRIPKHLLLCNTTAELPSDLHENVLIQLKTNLSFWGPYFQALPKYIDMPQFWSDTDLANFDNPNLLDHVQKEMREPQLKEFTRLTKKYPNISFTLDDFQLVRAWVASRAFSVNGWHCLSPLADMLNHNRESPHAYWTWRTSKTTGNTFFELRSEFVPVRGKEFTIAYYEEEVTNEYLFSEYGFVDIDSRVQRMGFDYPHNLENLARKQNITKNLMLSYYVDAPRLMRFFRTHIATEAELDTIEQAPALSPIKPPLSWKRELAAAEMCVQEMQRFKPRTNLLRNEFQYLYDTSLTGRQRTVLAYKTAYDRLFERTSTWCEQYIEFLLCSTEKRLKRVWGMGASRILAAVTNDELYPGGKAVLCR